MSWFRKKKTPAEEPMRCWLCGAHQEQVHMLVAGKDAAICDGCVHQAMVILRSRNDVDSAFPSGPLDLLAAQRRLNEAVIGHRGAKRALLETLQTHQATVAAGGDLRGPRILLVGPPGTGKSTLIRALALCTSLPFGLAHVASTSDEDARRVQCLPERLLGSTAGEVALAESAVVGIEALGTLSEPDEVASYRTPSRSSTALQRALLPVLEGADLSLPDGYPQSTFRSSTLMVVVALTVPVLVQTEQQARRALEGHGVLAEVLTRVDRVVVMPRRSANELTQVLAQASGPFEAVRPTAQGRGAELHLDPVGAKRLGAAAAQDPSGAWLLRRCCQRFLQRVVASARPSRKWQLDVAAAELLLE